MTAAAKIGGLRRDGTLQMLAGTLVLRAVALGGRFLFVIFAVKFMAPADFGKFGLLAALAVIIPSIVGFEAHQVFLRRILQSHPIEAGRTRRLYAGFVVGGTGVSFVVGVVTLWLFGWSPSEVLLGGTVIALEQLGLETFRNLINEWRPTLSVASVALRTGIWGVAVPALQFLGVLNAPWSLTLVLLFWIAGASAGFLAGLPIWHLFGPTSARLDIAESLVQLFGVLRRSGVWVAYNVSWQAISTGGRFFCAWMISEAASGRFTFLSMLASLSYVAQKGVVEPIYYPKLSALEATEHAYRQFGRINVAVVISGVLVSIAGLVGSVWLNGKNVTRPEMLAFGFLCIAFALLSLSQSAHYRLFRSHQDRAITLTAVAGAGAMLVSSAVLTWRWGVPGAAAGMMIGAVVLFATKTHVAGRLLRKQAGGVSAPQHDPLHEI